MVGRRAKRGGGGVVISQERNMGMNDVPNNRIIKIKCGSHK